VHRECKPEDIEEVRQLARLCARFEHCEERAIQIFVIATRERTEVHHDPDREAREMPRGTEVVVATAIATTAI